MKQSGTSRPSLPAKWLRAQRKKLEEERSRLREQIDRETTGLETTGTSHPREGGDRAEEAREDEEVSGVIDELRSRFQTIEEALERIASRRYGECIGCGAIIPRARLEAVPFAVRCQCAFLGWPRQLVEPLRRWTRRHQAASSAMDRAALSDLAKELHALVSELLAARRAGSVVLDDVTSQLMRVTVNGAALTDAELTSIFRNWTVGEVGSLAAAIGIVTRELAVNAHLQQTLRERPELLPAAIGETIARSEPVSAFSRVDFPTFGRPMMATLMRFADSCSSAASCWRSMPDVT